MKYRKRIYYTEADKSLMWDRWQKGNSLHEIARLFDRPHSSVRVVRYARSHCDWVVHPRRSAENLTVTVASVATAPTSLSRRLGVDRVGRSAVNWH